VAGLLLVDLSITLSTRSAIVETIDEVEPVEVALILGTSRGQRGKPNRFYQARIEAAAALYHAGRVRGILVSGDNATRYYNEPVSMQKDLMALAIPADHITLDYAGFRTLDSMVRAKEVFGLDQLLVVSQRFHVARAIFLARRFGIDARGFAAVDPPPTGYLKVRAREVLARAAAVLDIVTGRGPRFLGERETVDLREEPASSTSPGPSDLRPATEGSNDEPLQSDLTSQPK
jgi:SanA protein